MKPKIQSWSVSSFKRTFESSSPLQQCQWFVHKTEYIVIFLVNHFKQTNKIKLLFHIASILLYYEYSAYSSCSPPPPPLLFAAQYGYYASGYHNMYIVANTCLYLPYYRGRYVLLYLVYRYYMGEYLPQYQNQANNWWFDQVRLWKPIMWNIHGSIGTSFNSKSAYMAKLEQTCMTSQFFVYQPCVTKSCQTSTNMDKSGKIREINVIMHGNQDY